MYYNILLPLNYKEFRGGWELGTHFQPPHQSSQLRHSRESQNTLVVLKVKVETPTWLKCKGKLKLSYKEQPRQEERWGGGFFLPFLRGGLLNSVSAYSPG